MAIQSDYVTVAQQLYVAYFGRPADYFGLDAMTAALLAAKAPTTVEGLQHAYETNTGNIRAIVNGFGDSAESKALYAGVNDSLFITSIYQNVLKRNPDLAGLKFWVDAIRVGGPLNRADAALSIMAAAVGGQNEVDAQTVANKITVATNFTDAIGDTVAVNAYAGDAAAAAARAMLSSVNSTTDVVAYQANVTQTLDSMISIATVGSVFTLTALAEVMSGTAKNDTFNGVLAPTGATFQSGDQINGGEGTDTFAIARSGGALGGAVGAVSYAGIEKVLVSDFSTAATVLDMSLADSSLATVGLTASSSTADLTFNGLKKLVDAQMINGAGKLTLDYSAADVEGLTQNLLLQGQSAGTFTANDIDHLAVTSSTAANGTVIVAATLLEAITVTGDKAVALDATGDAALETVNASAMTAAFGITTDAATNLSIVAGTGNDSITINGNTFTAGDTVNGGDGADTLSIGGVAAINTALLANVSNVETLAVTSASTVTLATNVSATTFNFRDATDQVLVLGSGYTNATTVTLTGDSTNADKVDNSVANVTLTVIANVGDIDAATTLTGGSATDTLTLKANSDTAVFTNVTGFDAINLVDGTAAGADATLTLGAYGTALNVNASAMNGADEVLTVTHSGTKNLTVTGGAGNDVITSSTSGSLVVSGGAGEDAITAGSGNDSLAGGADNDTFVMGANLTADDTIDGGAGTDTLTVSSVSATALTHVSNVENLGITGISTVSLTANLGFSAFDLTDAAVQTLTLGTGYTGATSVVLTGHAGDIVANTANVAMTVVANAADLNGVTAIAGGTGTDTLTLKADNGNAQFNGVVTSIDAINIAKGATPGTDVTVTLGTYGTALNINAAALTGTDEVLTVSGGSATKNLTVTGGNGDDVITSGVGNDSIVGGAGNDAITSGAGNDNLSGGAGNDSFTFASGNFTFTDTVSGGSGTDTLSLSATAAISDIDFMNATGVETLTINSGSSTVNLASFAQAAGITTVNTLTASANTITAAGMTTGVTFNVTLDSAADNLVGGLGNDTFVYSDNDLATGDTINGTTGALDVIQLNNDKNADGTGDAVTAVLGAGVLNIDRLVVNDIATDNSFGDVTITLDTGFTQTALVVDASALDSGEDLTFSTVASGTTKTVNVTGGAGNDSINGGAANDTIVGGAGVDTITGGGGIDNLTGGTGDDVFVFAAADSTPAAIDTITDFATGSDVLTITVAAFAASTVADFTYKGTAASNSDGIALMSSKAGQFFFNTTNSQFVMDLTGNGLIQSDDMIINMTGATSMGSSDVKFNVTGSTAGDTITGGGNADTITGNGGADSILGGAGNDSIVGGIAADTIRGGAGADTLTSGTGADVFTYTTASESNGATAAAFDTITDLVLNAGTADMFDITATGTLTVATSTGTGVANFAAFDTTAEINASLNSATGTATALFTGGGNATALLVTLVDSTKYLVVDINGDGNFTSADLAIIVTGVTNTSFTTAVFV